MPEPTTASDRAAGEALLDEIAGDFLGMPGVQLGRMFNGRGLSVDGSIFVFVNRHGRLVAKLPEAETRALIGTGLADVVTMGARTMREWVSFGREGGPEAWRRTAADAHAYVSGLGTTS